MLEFAVSDYRPISGQKRYVTMHVYISIKYKAKRQIGKVRGLWTELTADL